MIATFRDDNTALPLASTRGSGAALRHRWSCPTGCWLRGRMQQQSSHRGLCLSGEVGGCCFSALTSDWSPWRRRLDTRGSAWPLPRAFGRGAADYSAVTDLAAVAPACSHVRVPLHSASEQQQQRGLLAARLLTDATNYVCAFDVFTGRKGDEKRPGAAAAVVHTLVGRLQEGCNHVVSMAGAHTTLVRIAMSSCTCLIATTNTYTQRRNGSERFIRPLRAITPRSGRRPPTPDSGRTSRARWGARPRG